MYSQQIFDKGAKNTQWGKDSLFNKQCWENWISTCKRIKLPPYLLPLTKINSKWIKDINVRPEIVRLLEENIGGKLLDIGLGNEILDMMPKPQAIKTKINKWNYITLKSFCTAKETINKMKRQTME